MYILSLLVLYFSVGDILVLQKGVLRLFAGVFLPRTGHTQIFLTINVRKIIKINKQLIPFIITLKSRFVEIKRNFNVGMKYIWAEMWTKHNKWMSLLWFKMSEMFRTIIILQHQDKVYTIIYCIKQRGKLQRRPIWTIHFIWTF